MRISEAVSGSRTETWVPAGVYLRNDESFSLINKAGGIVLFHDTKRQTAAMLPAFLRFLKNGGYRVVHVVAATP